MDFFEIWLRKHEFDQYQQQLLTQQIDCINVLAVLTENEIVNLAQKLNMDSMIQQKFINAVKRLSDNELISSSASSLIESHSLHHSSLSHDILCSEHKEQAKAVCEEDGVMVCPICLATTHHGHQISEKTIEEVYAEKREKLGILIQSTNEKNTMIKECIAKINETQVEMDERDTSIKAVINTFCDQAKRAWDDREKKLLEETKELVQKKNNTLCEQTDSLISSQRDLNKLICQAEKILSDQEEWNLFRIGRELQEKLDMLSKEKLILKPKIDSNITFTHDSSLFADAAYTCRVSDVPTSHERTTVKWNELIQTQLEKPFMPQKYHGTFVREWGSNGIEQSQFSKPYSIDVHNDVVYVADTSNHRIQVFRLDGSFIRMWGSCGKEQGQFCFPSYVAVSKDRVYVSDTENHRIQVFSQDGSFIQMWGSKGKEASHFDRPWGIAVKNNIMYVVDSNNHRIQVFQQDGTFIQMWGSKGNDPGQFNVPTGVAVNDNFIYVSEYNNHRIQVFYYDGTFAQMWGSYGEGEKQFSNPYGIAVDESIYVADYGNNRIQVFDHDGIFIHSWEMSRKGQGESCGIVDVAIDSNLFVVEYNQNRVQCFCLEKNPMEKSASGN